MDWSIFLVIFFVQSLAVITPGPDFILISQTALMHSRKDALKVVAGVLCGNLVHLSYCLFGLAIFIKQSPLIFLSIKLLGVSYMVYLGVRGLLLTGHSSSGHRQKISRQRYFFLQGLSCNLFNVKVILYLLSLFSLVLSDVQPFRFQLLLALEMLLISASWFGLTAYAISSYQFRKLVARYQLVINRILSVILLIFALSILFVTI